MPEGPEIRRTRDRIAALAEGQITDQVRFELPALAHWNGRFDATRVTVVESRGKALLTHFANGYSLYTHNQLYGRWVIVTTGKPPKTRRQLRLAIDTAKGSALLYSASTIELWPTAKLREHPFLARLGPDVLNLTTTRQTLIGRLLNKRFCNRQLGSLLTDQSFLAGLGNYLRCEVLFAAGIHPKQRPGELRSGQLELLVENLLNLPRQSYETGGITNDLKRAEALMAGGASFEEARFQLFRRSEEPCYRCGATIVFERQGGQGCYLCPVCQAGHRPETLARSSQ